MERPDNEAQSQELDRNYKVIVDAFDAAANYAKAKAADPKLPPDLRWEAMRPVFQEFVVGAPVARDADVGASTCGFWNRPVASCELVVGEAFPDRGRRIGGPIARGVYLCRRATTSGEAAQLIEIGVERAGA